MLRVRLSKARAERVASERRRQAKRRSNGTNGGNKGTLGRAEVYYLCFYHKYCHCPTVISTITAMLRQVLLCVF
jgi:hypothetical protein